MDIAGAKALKQRLGASAADDVPPAPADVPEDAPPIYHWVGVGQAAADAQPVAADDQPGARGVSLFRRLGLSFR